MLRRVGVLRSAVVVALIAVFGILPLLPKAAAAQAPGSISGTVTFPGAYAADAEVSAVAFRAIGTPPVWTAVAGSDVATSGAYTIGELEAGTYRVGFFDAARVYRDTFYLNRAAVTEATDTPVAAGQDVMNINQTLVENPLNVVEGKVNFTGASGSPVGVELYRWETIDGLPQWHVVHSRTTKPDGSFRMHTGATGTFRIGFIDYSDTFGAAFHSNATTIGAAPDISVNNPGTPVTSISATMSLIPSARKSGADRFETAAALSQERFEDGFGGTVVLVSGRSPYDGLCAGVYAYAVEAPLLLTDTLSMPEATLAEIERLMPYEVVIVGGTSAVSLHQEQALRRMGVPVVRRLAGQDRYATAVQAAEEIINRGMAGDGLVPQVFIASGQNFADALAVAPVAAAAGRPILFVKADEAPSATLDFLERRITEAPIVIGGTKVVSEAVAAAVGASEEDRLAGRNRYATAAAIAAYGIDTLAMSARSVGLASGTGFADALAAGPYLAGGRRTLLLTDPTELSADTKAFLENRSVSMARIICVGGKLALSDTVYNEAIGKVAR